MSGPNHNQAHGCCTGCGGTGTSNDPETNGACWDCRGTGHAHDGPCATVVPHTDLCDDDGCYCPDDVFWGRLLGDDDPCAPGKDWAATAFNGEPVEVRGEVSS